ncbi:MAG TPA: response regulator [Terracidiphilus sp.]|nr:response regulator [Terracidiphilus sp.]
MPALPGSRRILIVDDEPTIAETLDLIFSTRGYEVRTANSAEETIELLSQWRPDLAMLDVMLPQMNGIDLGIAIRANYPDCKVLLLSGHPSAGELLETAKEKGHVFDLLAKPLHPSFILDTVSALLPSTGGPAEA